MKEEIFSQILSVKEKRPPWADVFKDLQQTNTGFFADGHGFLIPDTGLHLTDVAAAHHQHAKTALADTAADGQGQFIIQKHLVEG